MAIHILKGAVVEVRAPLKTPISEIERFITYKEKWLVEHIALQASRDSEVASFKLDYGSSALYGGKEYPITSCTGSGRGFDGNKFCVPKNLNSQQIKAEMIKVYKELAKAELPKRVAFFAGIMGVTPTGVHISSAKTRWGSCSGNNSITFSWHLILADCNLVDYIVIHELAHIKEHNHSPRFWAAVGSVLPNYKEYKQGLKLLQRRIAGEDWTL